jgi:dipeptidyl aminopeptidase/acylaminoacyl peptidase
MPAMLKWFLLLISIPIALFAGCQVTSLIDAISLARWESEQIAFGTQVAVEKNCLLEQGLSGDYSGRLAFDNDGEMTIFDLETMNFMTGSPVNVMSSPDWNPISGRALILGHYDVYLLDSITWQITRLDEGGFPSWNPDGTQFVYFRREPPGLSIFDLDTTTHRMLPIKLRRQAAPTDPAWSPDGQTIAFAMQNSDGYIDIFSVPATCSESSGCPLTQLTDSPGESQSYQPSWSPDGSHIAFTRSTSGVWHGAWTIHSMKADGTDVRQLTESPTSSEISDFNPTYSPNGEFIAFDRGDKKVPGPRGRNIYIMRNDGSEVTCLSSMPGIQPDWTDLPVTESISSSDQG